MEEEYLFFGREVQRGQLIALLREHRFVAVLGASGSGKSSLVRAGLLPALFGGVMTQAGSHCLLLEAAHQEQVSVYVVLTMRSDFFGDCSQFDDLPEAINRGEYLVPRLTRDQKKQPSWPRPSRAP